MTTLKFILLVLAILLFTAAFRILPSILGSRLARRRLGPKLNLQPTATLATWGDAFDPDADCRFDAQDAALSITVPGTVHDLSVEQGRVTAPRVLRTVEGDFDVEVTVAGGIAPDEGRTTSYALPYHGAGLLLWLDRDSYIRLERAAIHRDGEPLSYVNLEKRSASNLAASFGEAVSEGPVRLRLQRRGREILAAYRVGADGWTEFPRRLTIRGWPSTLQIGVVAVNCSTAPLRADFRDLRVEPARP